MRLTEKKDKTRIIRIGTRSSKLAVCQANWVKDQLIEKGLAQEIELIPIKTKGDKILDSPLAKIGGKGLFVKEIEEALIGHKIDFAVHSMKDVPTQLIEGLTIAAITEREDYHDVLISKMGRILTHLPNEAFIGTSSLRRQSQILHHFPTFQIVQIRGNLETRLRRVQGDDLDAVIVAAAGIHRLRLEEQITEYLPTYISLPAIGQGALGIETRIGDEYTLGIVSHLNDPKTYTAITSERSFLNRLGGSCQIPIAALAEIKGNGLTIEGMVASFEGKRMIREILTGPSNKAKELGIALAEILLKKGAQEILEEIAKQNESNQDTIYE